MVMVGGGWIEHPPPAMSTEGAGVKRLQISWLFVANVAHSAELAGLFWLDWFDATGGEL